MLPSDLNWNATGWLVYDQNKPLPQPALVIEFNHYDDFSLVPYDKAGLYSDADQTITLDVISKCLPL